MEGSLRESKLLRWPIFSLLDINFLQTAKLACVFGSAANEALLVTQDDDVYSVGANDNGCLGIGDSRSSLLPRKVEQLCKKGTSSLLLSHNYDKFSAYSRASSPGFFFVQMGNGLLGIAPCMNGDVFSFRYLSFCVWKWTACGCCHNEWPAVHLGSQRLRTVRSGYVHHDRTRLHSREGARIT